jgi:tetratricopeptide (TPR) repeat protein
MKKPIWYLLALLPVGFAVAVWMEPNDEPPAPEFFDGFDGYHWRITTSSPLAQRLFDQGMQMLYGFNRDGALKSFRSATVADPNCAMAWWGVASACGPHLNQSKVERSQSKRAFQASQAAVERAGSCSDVEQALIHAISVRYDWPPVEDQSRLEKAYSDALSDVYRLHGDHPDVGALYAESMMNLQPWRLWTSAGKPIGSTMEIARVLEVVLRQYPLHPGANHFYIHVMEASPHPEKAIASADRLVDLVPGAGHLVHMPSHIYVRVGRYADAVDVNEKAIAADDAYLAQTLDLIDSYSSVYSVHNAHMLAYAAMMEGRFEKAMQAVDRLEVSVSPDVLRDNLPILDGLMAARVHVLIRFGRWHEILQIVDFEESRQFSRLQRRYARAIALAATGKPDQARRECAHFESIASRMPSDWKLGLIPAPEVIRIARQMMRGEILFREGSYDEAFAALAIGAQLEDELLYDEPPGWMQPVRHAWGALLMARREFGKAARVYRDDLQRNPKNGWSLLGLQQALAAQGEEQAAAEIASERLSAWKRADVCPMSSCYCEPCCASADSVDK